MNVSFPLIAMRHAAHFAARKYWHGGYRYRSPMLINAPAPTFLLCGSKPLDRVVNVSAQYRGLVTGFTCYLDCDGKIVIPA